MKSLPESPTPDVRESPSTGDPLETGSPGRRCSLVEDSDPFYSDSELGTRVQTVGLLVHLVSDRSRGPTHAPSSDSKSFSGCLSIPVLLRFSLIQVRDRVQETWDLGKVGVLCLNVSDRTGRR